MNWQSIEDFQGSETILSWWIHVSVHLTQCVQHTRPRMNPLVNY